MFVDCVHPKIILNPQLQDLLSMHCHYRLFGEDRVLLPDKFYSQYSVDLFFHFRNQVTFDNIEDQVVLGSDGSSYPIYLAVPCGECDICLEHKHNSIVQRCELESQLYNCVPWFITLTYSNDHLPSDGVSVTHCQNFMKRLRINLERSGYSNRLRYYLVSEYSPTKFRPHYHLILFNVDAPNLVETLKISDIIKMSWPFGFVSTQKVDFSSSNAFHYTSKYMSKYIDYPSHLNHTFSLASNRHGGLGSSFIRSLVSFARQSFSTSLQYVDKFTGRVKDLHIDKYVMRYLFPSFSQSVPRVFRNAVKSFVSLFNRYSKLDWVSFNFSDTYNKLLSSSLRHYIAYPFCSSKLLSSSRSSCLNAILEVMFKLEDTILLYIDNLDFDYYWSLHLDRRRYYDKLLEHMVPSPDLWSRNFELSRSHFIKEHKKLQIL